VILNALSGLAAFAALLRAAIGLIVLFVGVRALRRWRSPLGPEPGTGEERFYLVFALSATLLGLAVVSWPLLYLVLQSYVPEWPGVMCIQGVTRIGAGSVGAASSLPGLVGFLEGAKPALVFVAGAWLVLHLVNRRGRTGALTGRVLWVLLLFGCLATIDGAGELAYLLIPKQETFLAAGCCTVGADPAAAAGAAPPALLLSSPEPSHGWLTAAFLSVGLAVVLAVSVARRRLRRPAGGGRWLAFSLVGALVSVPLGLAFLSAVAAPAFLRLPYHPCPYCLIASAPESLVGIVLYVSGVFGVGWAGAARWLGATPEGSAGNELCLRLLRIARFGFLASLLMATVKLIFP
jgi:hypothetical protein